ncbi:hypothetical protein EDD28_1804 [Salana multivorans]|uniref:N-acetyltransferase domain-containing protein n=1 Tax=Salana multivorans TaxID=120377 RepID=A0A3N2DC19_9MICO|nr:GNAT family N-acetyltransferase [Salana multivorans]ROR97208.1 hypothetical protein EDD28_1804 [Salana multivorans]
MTGEQREPREQHDPGGPTDPQGEAEPTIGVAFDATRGRYEITVDGMLAGFASTTLVDGVHVFDHTVVDPAFQGRGLAGILVDRAIGDVVGRGGRFTATCSYVVRWLERHHQYDTALVPGT